MRYLFSSGEIMYGKNKKDLKEGKLEGEFLEYATVEPDTKFYCIGKINKQDVKVGFMVSDNDFEAIRSRHLFGILMQSDIFHANWKNYEIVEDD